jgi:iron complex transport system substrate-binding protein
MSAPKRKLLSVAIAVAGLLAPSASAAQTVEPFADISRLVAIGGSLTETVFALGEGERLVARDQTALYPEAAMALPDVGYMRALSPEGVLSVNPTALLLIEGSGPPEAVDVLTQVGIEYRTVPESYSSEGVLDKIREVGEALGVSERAQALVAELDSAFASLQSRTEEIVQRKKVLFVLSLAGGKMQASGSGTAAHGMIELAGAVNAITGYSGYKALTEEAIVTAAPDIILVMDRGGELDIADQALAEHPAIALTPAGQQGAFVRLDGSYMLNFGPRTPQAAQDLFDHFYPER